ncbi:ABC transporter permease, partial [candidate division KSB1 bacterium]
TGNKMLIISTPEYETALSGFINWKKEKAGKYFGDENPIGKTIMVDTTGYEITGVVKNTPGNTHFKYNFLMSMKTIANNEYMNRGWQSPANMPTYIKLAPGVNPEEFAKQITQIVRVNMKEFLERDRVEYASFLQPVQDIYLRSDLIWELGLKGNLLYIYIFSGIGVFILLIASMNFVNLSTARSANRAKEVGMRKVAGASRRQVIWQFLSESVITSVFAMTAALIIVFILLPFFNDLAVSQFKFSSLFKINNILMLSSLIIIIGIFAGSYPALFLSTFRPVSTLKGVLRTGTRGGLLRKVLVVGQFSISITLIIGTFVFYQQLQYMKNQPLGFDKKQKLIINMEGNRVGPNSYKTVKSEFKKNPSVLGVSFSSSVPGKWRYRWRQYPTGERETNLHAIRCMQVDYDFFELYNLKIISGRKFTPDMASRGYILNETAVSTFGWDSPETALTKTLREVNTPILGVMKDYHFAGLQQQIEPLGIFLMLEDYRYLTLKVDMKDINNTIASIEKKYNELFPNTVFDYFFLDTDFNSQYEKEDRLGKIFGVFTFFGIFIACLGLFGLAAFMAEQRTKEIGIRKVLGATVSKIIFMLSGEFTKWIIIANFIAWPVSWYLLDKWIQYFAYRIDISFIPFFLAGLLTLIISAITVSYQSFKAAYANPVDSLRDE